MNTRALRLIEWSSLKGMLVREIINFVSFWRSATFSAVVNPTVYLLAFGFGFGSLVSRVAGYNYIEYIGTGIVATTVMFAGTFPAMFSVFVKQQFQHTYDAILSAPVNTEEIVTGEVLWIGARVSVYATVPVLIAMFFGLDPSWGMFLVPPIAFLSGLGWAAFGIFIAGISKTIESFSYWQGAFLTPIFLVAGTFFPLDGLPEWAQTLGRLNPLWHCIELVRHVVFLKMGSADLVHLLFLVVFGVISWLLAIKYMRKKLIL